MADEITAQAQAGEPGTEEGGLDMQTIKDLLFAIQSQPQQPLEAAKSVLSQRGRGARFALGFFNQPLAAQLLQQDADINRQNQELALGQQERSDSALGALSQILDREQTQDRLGVQQDFEFAQAQVEGDEERRSAEALAAGKKAEALEAEDEAARKLDIQGQDAEFTRTRAELTSKVMRDKAASEGVDPSMVSGLNAMADIMDGVLEEYTGTEQQRESLAGIVDNLMGKDGLFRDVAADVTSDLDLARIGKLEAETAKIERGSARVNPADRIPPTTQLKLGTRAALIEGIDSIQNRIEEAGIKLGIENLKGPLADRDSQALKAELTGLAADIQSKIFGATIPEGEAEIAALFIPFIRTALDGFKVNKILGQLDGMRARFAREHNVQMKSLEQSQFFIPDSLRLPENRGIVPGGAPEGTVAIGSTAQGEIMFQTPDGEIIIKTKPRP